MVAFEFPMSLPEISARLGAETSTSHRDALGGYDARIVKRNITVVIG